MNEKLIKVIRRLKDEILNILLQYDLTIEKQARRALDQINSLYDRLGIVVEEIIPADVLQAYLRGTATTGFGVPQSLGSGLYAVTEISDNIMTDLSAAIRTARTNTNSSIMDALTEVQSELRQGVASMAKKRAVTVQVAESFSKHGMTSFITSDGKKLPLDFYSEVVTRTNMRHAEVKGAVDWMQDNGYDLVKIKGVVPTCQHCWAYRDMVFSLSGKDERFPAFKEVYMPPYHPHCMCEVVPYYDDDPQLVAGDIEHTQKFQPEKDTRPENIRKAYDKRQAMNRQNNAEKKQYNAMKLKLGEEVVPKTLGAFKRMKRGKTKRYRELQKMMRGAGAE